MAPWAGDIVEIWKYSLENHEHQLITTTDVALRHMALSPDNRRLAAGCVDASVRVWDIESGAALAKWEGHENWTDEVAFTPDGRYLASGGFDQQVLLWDMNRLEAAGYFKGHTNEVWTLAFNHEGTQLFTAGKDEWIRVWDMPPHKRVAHQFTLTTHSRFGKVSAARDAVFHVTEDDRIVYRKLDALDDLVSLSLPSNLSGLTDSKKVAMSFRPALLAVALPGHPVSVYRLPQFERVSTGQPPPETSIRELSICPDARFMATRTQGGLISVWDLATGKKQYVLATTYARANRMELIGHNRVVVMHQQNRLSVVDFVTPKEIKTWIPHKTLVSECSMTPDGQSLITGGHDGTVAIWNSSTFELDQRLRGPLSEVFGLGISEDGTRVAAGYADGRVVVWDLVNRLQVATLLAHPGRRVGEVAFANNDKTLIAMQGSDITVWRTE